MSTRSPVSGSRCHTGVTVRVEHRLTFFISVALALATPARSRAQQTSSDTPPSGKIQAAEGAALRWLILIDSTRYAASWDSASTLFHRGVTRSAWQEAVVAARQPVDPLGDRHETGAQYTHQLPNVPPGEYVVLQFGTVGRGKTHLTETVFLSLEPDGAWRVAGYFIKPA